MTRADFDLTKLRVGDVFNYIPLPISEAKDPIDWMNRLFAKSIAVVTWGKYNHTSQIVSIIDTQEGPIITITEALPKVGVQTKQFNPKWLPNVTIYRFGTVEQAGNAAAWWYSKTGSEYALLEAGLAGARNFFNFFREMPLIFDDPGHYFCSNGISMGFATQKVRIAKVHPSQCTPSDVDRNGKYGEILE